MVERIDPRIDEPTRMLLGFVLNEDLDDLEQTLERVTDEGSLIPVMTLVGRVAAVAVVQRCDDRAPTKDDFDRIADEVTDSYSGSYPLERAGVHALLTNVLFGETAADVALGADKSVLVPLIVTAELLQSAPGFQSWHEYLDVLEAGLEESGNTSYLTAPDSKRT